MLRQHDLGLEEFGYMATRHRCEVGGAYFDLVAQAVSAESSTVALHGRGAIRKEAVA